MGIGKKSRRDDICRIIEFDYLKKDRASPIPTIWKFLIILYFVNGNYRSGLSTALRGKHPELVVCRPFRAWAIWVKRKISRLRPWGDPGVSAKRKPNPGVRRGKSPCRYAPFPLNKGDNTSNPLSPAGLLGCSPNGRYFPTGSPLCKRGKGEWISPPQFCGDRNDEWGVKNLPPDRLGLLLVARALFPYGIQQRRIYKCEFRFFSRFTPSEWREGGFLTAILRGRNDDGNV